MRGAASQHTLTRSAVVRGIATFSVDRESRKVTGDLCGLVSLISGLIIPRGRFIISYLSVVLFFLSD